MAELRSSRHHQPKLSSCFDDVLPGLAVDHDSVNAALRARRTLRVAGDLHALAAGRWGGGLEPVDKGQGLALKISFRSEPGGINQNAKHAVDDGSYRRVAGLVPGAVATERAAKQLAGHSHAKALVLAKSE